jgi:hypothetical protein
MERFRAAVERGIEQIGVVKHRIVALFQRGRGDLRRLPAHSRRSCNHSTNQAQIAGKYVAEYAIRVVRAIPPINRQIDDDYLRERTKMSRRGTETFGEPFRCNCSAY